MINFEENYVPLIFNKEGDRNNWHTGSSFYFLDNNGIKKIIEKYIKNNKIDFSFTNNLLISDYNLIFPLLNTLIGLPLSIESEKIIGAISGLPHGPYTVKNLRPVDGIL